MGTLIEVQGRTEVVQFRSIDAAENTYSEAWLQEILRRHPEVLPVEEFGPVFQPLIPIGKEFPTEVGPIDNLFISHAGYLVLVETKLWRNPEAKREVVAQLWDYARALSHFTYAKLDDLAKDYLRKCERFSLSLQEWVETRIEPVDLGFQRRVSRSLKLGRFLLLIVTDHARPALLDMLRVNAYPSLAMDTGIVELRPFRRASQGKSSVLLVPYVAGRTEIIERSVVEVTVQDATDSRVAVRRDGYQDEKDRRRRIPLISEDAFWELMHQQAPDSDESARKLIDELRSEHGREIEINLRESSIVIEAIVPESEVSIPLFFLKTNGTLACWPETIKRRALEARLPDDLPNDYIASMRKVLGTPPSRVELSQRVKRIDFDAFRRIVARFIKQIEEASP